MGVVSSTSKAGIFPLGTRDEWAVVVRSGDGDTDEESRVICEMRSSSRASSMHLSAKGEPLLVKRRSLGRATDMLETGQVQKRGSTTASANELVDHRETAYKCVGGDQRM